jgi:hypothetical protein
LGNTLFNVWRVEFIISILSPVDSCRCALYTPVPKREYLNAITYAERILGGDSANM